MSNSNPLVSAIVVNLNRKDELRECLNSLLAQDYKNIEIIVIDNGSTDGSPEMVSEEYPQVKLIRLDRNLGCPGGRNVGILNSKGEILFFLDNDAMAEPDAISKIVKIFLKKPDVFAVVPKTINYHSKETRSVTSNKKSENIPRYIPVVFGSSAIKRIVFEKVGLYPHDYMYGGEETDLSYRMLENRFLIYYLPDALIYHKISNVERNRKWEFRNRFRNDLITLGRYAPWFIILIGTVKKSYNYLKEAIKRGYLIDYFIVMFKMPFILLKVCFNRAPLKTETFLLAKYLNSNLVEEWKEGEFIANVNIKQFLYKMFK